MPKRVTIREVAQQAHVSVAAVSRVLNNKPMRITEATRTRIREVAAELGYVPNVNAQALVTHQSKLLMLIIPDIENMFFASFAKQLEDAARDYGYLLIVANADEQQDQEQALLQQVSARGIDGTFIIPTLQSCHHSDQLIAAIDSMTTPVVCVDRVIADLPCDAVGLDHREGGRLAARTLLEHGHRKLACVTAEHDIISAAERAQSFVQTVQEFSRNHKHDPATVRLFEGGYKFEGGYACADAIIGSDITAVFCCNDNMAMGIRQRCAERAVNIPQDLSIVGYDAIAQRFMLGAMLTTIVQDVTSMATTSMALMMERLQEADQQITHEPRVQILPVHLQDHGTVQQL